MELIRNFKELSKGDAGITGGKGASLGEMTKAGIQVPPGFVVLTGAFERFIEETGLFQGIDAALQGVDHSDMHTIDNASKKIQALILSREMPEDIATAIQNHFKELNCTYVAVRSSATAEDGKDHAWAGQLDSYLNTTETDFLEKVQQCWASLFTPRAIFYRFEKELHAAKISVAVVVQKMVDSEMSGIAFSVHPVTEDRNQLIIEAGFGLGEAIVSGQITPDSYVVEKEPRKIVDVNVSVQTRGLYRKEKSNGKADGDQGNDLSNNASDTITGNEWHKLGEKGKLQVLTEAQILELSDIILKIEKHYGSPCDIEWAYEAGEFYIVQSRPITTLLDRDNEKYRLIFASDGFAVMNVFNLRDAGYIRGGGVLTAENNNKVSLYIRTDELDHYGKIGYDIFSSKEKTKQLMNDIQSLIKSVQEIDLLHTNGLETYTNEMVAHALEDTSALSIKFVSLYGMLETHHTFYTEELINQYVEEDHEGLKGKTVFDVIFNDKEKIKDQKIRELCENVAVLAQFKFSTKETMYDMFNSHTSLVKESRKRFNLKAEDNMRILSIREIRNFLVNGFDRIQFDQLTEERKDWFAMRSSAQGHVEVFNGTEAQKLIEQVKHMSGLSHDRETVRELKGQTASVGFYTGRAVVIPYIRSTEDDAYKLAFAEFKQGDVLVTKNTVPDIMEIIKKAGAIVTEEGGITCHGAIMSREFKVPGIVGVDGVADLVKTGDMVEIDARQGKGKISILQR